MKTDPHYHNDQSAASSRLRGLMNGKRVEARALAGAMGVFFLAAALSLRAQTITQTNQLASGWNAIWVELEPTDNAIGAVFTNLPIESVWAYTDRVTPVEFIQSPDELPWNNPGWRRYFPPGSPHAILTTIFAVTANQTYLVKMTNAAPLVITGRPSLKPQQWVPDSFNLSGFRVSEQAPPPFGTYLAPSMAHAGQAVYRLVNNAWTLVNPSEPIRAGEAYWVYCRGASTYSGPLQVSIEQGDGLDFGIEMQRKTLSVKKLPMQAGTLTIKQLGAPSSSPLFYVRDGTNGPVAQPLPTALATNLPDDRAESLQLAIRRKAMTELMFQSVLEMTDNLGSRILVPINAEKVETPLVGLWVGSASVSKVSEANSTNAAQPTKSAFDLRLLVHVETNGTARLLKEVIQMWQAGSYTTNAGGSIVTNRPPRHVLVTDDTLISRYQGTGLRDGVPVGRRLSTVGFDFVGGTNNYLPLTGTFGTNGLLTGTIILEPDFPTNPYKHKYHPDHDNLDAQFAGMTADATGSKEAYRVVRQIRLDFDPDDVDPASVQSLDYGYDVIGGTYQETVTGLHKSPIVAEGQFRLSRVSSVGVLNQ